MKAAKEMGALLIKQGFDVVNAPVPKECGKDINDYLINYLNKNTKSFKK